MDPLDRLLSKLRQASEASQSAKDAALMDSGLTKAQYNALLLLASGHGATVTQLASSCGVSQQAMSQTTKRLVAAGYVVTARSPHGGRAIVLSVSDRGRSSLEIADARVKTLDERLRQAVAPMDIESFTAALDQVRDAALLTT